jgi:hypothetical protein
MKGKPAKAGLPFLFLSPLQFIRDRLRTIAALSINGYWHDPANWNEIGPQALPNPRIGEIPAEVFTINIASSSVTGVTCVSAYGGL